MTIASTSAALEFIWAEQEGLFELVSTPSQRRRYSKTEALASLDGKRYYGPLARTRNGSKKADIANIGNVLWADIDSLDIEERLARLPIAPSLVVLTGGRGFWVYYKLVSAIPTDTIEALNIGLAALLDGDHCHNRDRLARIPGSTHDSGRRGQIVDFNAVVYEPDELAFLGAVERQSSTTLPTVAPSDVAVSFSAWPRLSAELWLYVEREPRRGQYGYDRSDMEQKIFTALVYQGWSDKEIMNFADVNRIPRHHQERRRRNGYDWTQRSIDKARAWLREHPNSENDADTSLMNGMCMTSETKRGYSHSDRHQALRLVDGTQTTAQLIQDWMTKLPSTPSYSTAHRMLKQFRGGTRPYIQNNGRLWQLTERGIHHTKDKFNYLMPLPLAGGGSGQTVARSTLP